MATSRIPGPMGKRDDGLDDLCIFHGFCPAESPGTMGRYDQNDPDCCSLMGDTPGTLGRFDYSDPDMPKIKIPFSVQTRLMFAGEMILQEILRGYQACRPTSVTASGVGPRSGQSPTSQQMPETGSTSSPPAGQRSSQSEKWKDRSSISQSAGSNRLLVKVVDLQTGVGLLGYLMHTAPAPPNQRKIVDPFGQQAEWHQGPLKTVDPPKSHTKWPTYPPNTDTERSGEHPIGVGLLDYLIQTTPWKTVDLSGQYAVLSQGEKIKPAAPMGPMESRGTFSIGATVNIQLGIFTFTGSVGYVVDSYGNVGWYKAKGPGVGLGEHFSAGLSTSISNAQTIFDLAGPFANGSFGGGWVTDVSADYYSGPSDHGWVTGGGLTVAIGAGGGGASTITWTDVYYAGHLGSDMDAVEQYIQQGFGTQSD